MTLVELLVTAAVLALFVLITDRVFIATNLTSRTTQRAADMQQNARVAAMRLRREIRESRGSAVTCHPDASCSLPSTQVAFPSARPSEAASVFCLDVAMNDPGRRPLESACSTPIPLSGTYTPVWQRFVGYHLSADGELRRVVQAGPITLPMAASSGQVVATQVTTFTVSRTGRRFRLRLKSLSRDAGGGGGTPPQEMVLDDTVELRNALFMPGA
jgi:Tfp pilus assembly protein PilE